MVWEASGTSTGSTCPGRQSATCGNADSDREGASAPRQSA